MIYYAKIEIPTTTWQWRTRSGPYIAFGTKFYDDTHKLGLLKSNIKQPTTVVAIEYYLDIAWWYSNGFEKQLYPRNYRYSIFRCMSKEDCNYIVQPDP